MNTSRITLSQYMGRWVATFHDDPDVLALFGTDTLPTPYRASSTDPAMIVRMIEAQNPGVPVVLAEVM